MPETLLPGATSSTVHQILGGDPAADLHYIRKHHRNGEWGTALCGYSTHFSRGAATGRVGVLSICPACAVLYNALPADGEVF